MLVINFSGYASLKNSNITLIGGSIKPHETLVISLSPLLPNVSYNVLAKINDPNNKKNKVILKVLQEDDGGSMTAFFVNNVLVAGPQFRLTQVDNTVILRVWNNINPITITNLDDTDYVTVTATATPYSIN